MPPRMIPRRRPPARGFRLALSALSTLFVLAGLAASAVPARAGLFNPTTFSLDNGLQVVVIEDHRVPVITHMVWYKIGAADEPPGKSGIAHFLEHLMFKATERIASGEFSKIIARNGGRDNAFTADDYTGYFQTIAADKLDLVMGLEADRMSNLRLTEDEVAAERQVILEERRSRTDNNPGAQLSEAMGASQYMAHPYRIPIIGWAHEVEALSREDALAFYRRYYVPNNAILIVAGDVTPDGVRALAQKHFGAKVPGDIAPRVRPQEPPQLTPRRLSLADPKVRQPSWRRSYLAPSRRAGAREHALPLSLLADILGGGATSRLYRRLVVEKQIASSVGSYYRGASYDLATFLIYASPVPGGALEPLEQEVDAVLAEILDGGVTETELKRAKDGMLASAIWARDNLSTAPRVFGSALTAGLSVEDVESWPDRIAVVSADQVLAAARHVFDLRRSVTGSLLPQTAR